MYIADPSISSLNTFIGSTRQQATSVVTQTNQSCYEGGIGCFSVYGFEYKPGFDNAVRSKPLRGRSSRFLYGLQYISWISDSKLAWTLFAAGLGPDPLTEISARPISQEPMVCPNFTKQCGLIFEHPFSISSLIWGSPRILAPLTWTTYRSLCTSRLTTYACTNLRERRISAVNRRASLPRPTSTSTSMHIITQTSPLGWTTIIRRCRGKSVYFAVPIKLLRVRYRNNLLVQC